jgi:uncharacterized membrane protein YhaH (DUF805 family)
LSLSVGGVKLNVVGAMDWSYLLTSFEGRIGRQSFWIALLAVLAVEIAAHILAYNLGGDRPSAIVDLAFSYPEFAIFLKRGHDRDLPLWPIGSFFGVAVLLDFLVILGWVGSLEDADPLVLILTTIWLVFALALLVDLGFRRGTIGPNRHGADPPGGT